MKLNVSVHEFESWSNEKKKKYIARLFIAESGAKSVADNDIPVAFVMAGLPGAGKTEFLDTIAEALAAKKFDPFVRIDLDEIVSVYPNYTPKDYYKFRSQGNLVLARTIDEARRGRYNMLIDGTFSGLSGASVGTIGKLLDKGYRVNMVYMYDTPESAWYYTEKRKIKTGRAVDRNGFMQAGENLKNNLLEALSLYADNPAFTIDVVKQKKLRDNKYHIITDKSKIDKFIRMDYTEGNEKED